MVLALRLVGDDVIPPILLRLPRQWWIRLVHVRMIAEPSNVHRVLRAPSVRDVESTAA